MVDPPKLHTATSRTTPADGRGYLGLALLGWGLSILLGIIPHEDAFVGIGLALFGAALVATAPRLPGGSWLAPIPLAAAGLGVALFVVGFSAWTSAPLDLPKLTLVLLGAACVAAAPWLRRSLRRDRPGRTPLTVATVVACTLAALGGPLAVWATQALFKGVVGITPVEAFVQVALLVPLGWILPLLGMPASQQGQTLTYATRGGPMSLEVGAACSGLQAMALFAVVLAIYLVAEKPGGRRLAVWSLIGLAGVYVANLLRLVMLFVVGYQWGPDALLRAHAEAGWVFFVAWAVVFAWLARRSRPSEAQRPTS